MPGTTQEMPVFRGADAMYSTTIGGHHSPLFGVAPTTLRSSRPCCSPLGSASPRRAVFRWCIVMVSTNIINVTVLDTRT